MCLVLCACVCFFIVELDRALKAENAFGVVTVVELRQYKQMTWMVVVLCISLPRFVNATVLSLFFFSNTKIKEKRREEEKR